MAAQLPAIADPAAATSVTDFSQYAGLRAAAQRNDPKALQQAARQFESLFTEMMLKSAHETKFGDDLTGEQGEFYQDLFDQQMATQMSSGKGLGLADMLVRQLKGSTSLAAGGTSPAASGSAPGSAQAAASAYSSAAQGSGDWKPDSPQAFVDAVRPHAEKAAAELGIPARALIAQAALETGWGQHIARGGNGSSGMNLFGIKAQSGYAGSSATQQTSEFENGSWTRQQASFRTYDSIASSFDDYVGFLKNNPRYADALRAGNVHDFAKGLQKAGYATDPHYAQKLMKVAYGAQMQVAYAGSPTVRA